MRIQWTQPMRIECASNAHSMSSVDRPKVTIMVRDCVMYYTYGVNGLFLLKFTDSVPFPL